MSYLRRLLPERRNVSFQSVFKSGGDFDAGKTHSGVTVTQTKATQLAAVFACVRLLADLVATLPVDAVRVRADRRDQLSLPTWMAQPIPADPNHTRINHFMQVIASLLLDGNAFVFTGRDRDGNVVELLVLNPEKVEVKSGAGQRKLYLIGDEKIEASHLEVLHIPLILRGGEIRGISPIEELRQVVGLGLSADEYQARQFGQGITLPGVIQMQGDATKEQREEIRDAWKKYRMRGERAGLPGILTGGATWQSIGITNEQAQFLETRQYQRSEIAGIYRVPPFLIGDNSPGAVAYASVEAQMESLRINTVQPMVNLIEAAYNRLLPRGTGLKFNTNAIVRADIEKRYQAYSVGLQSGFTTVDRINALEDQPPLPGGDVLRVPLAVASATDADRKTKVDQAVSLINAGGDPADVMRLVGLPEVAFTKPAPPVPPQEPAP